MSDEEKDDLWTERDRTLPRQEGDRPEDDPEEFFKAGMFLLKRDKVKEAHAAFKRALFLREQEPRYMSYTGLTLAMAMGRRKRRSCFARRRSRRSFSARSFS